MRPLFHFTAVQQKAQKVFYQNDYMAYAKYAPNLTSFEKHKIYINIFLLYIFSALHCLNSKISLKKKDLIGRKDYLNICRKNRKSMCCAYCILTCLIYYKGD